MATAIRPITVKCGKCEYYNDGDCRKPVNMDCDTNEDIFSECDALYEAGYRKASAVVLEVIDEIEKINTQYCTTIASAVIKAHLNAIKKKYTEGGE